MLPLLLVLAFGQLAPVASQSYSSIAADMSPVRKVVTLLEDMKSTVEKEAKDDLTAYDKYMCWCETNDKEKTEAIKNAEAKIEALTAFIDEAAAKEGELKTEISDLKGDIADDTEALSTATANRKKEHETFLETEADYKETRGLLQEAIEVLSKVQLLQKQGKKAAPELVARAQSTATALLQVRDGMQQRFPKFQSIMQRDLFDILGSMEQSTSLRKRTALSQTQLLPWEKTDEQIGMEANPNDLKGAAANAKSFNSRSGGILGVLKEMQDEFARDLSKAQYEDMEAEIAFQNLKAAKLAEIAAATKQKNQKESELADLLDKAAKAKEDREATTAALEADQGFLVNLKENCKTEDEEHQIRVKARNTELVALAEALKILNEDAARDLFGKTMSFVQVGAVHQSSAVEQAAAQDHAVERAMQRIAKTASKSKNWALASLAVRVRLDGFAKVKEVMDKMLVELAKQQKEEYAKWETCKKDVDETEDSIKEAENTKEDLDEKHLGLTNLLETLTKEISDLQTEEAEMEMSLKAAGEERKEQNSVFQTSIMDQRATINILDKALKRLKIYYTPEKEETALNQVKQTPGAASAAPPPRPSFDKYQKSAGAGGVLQLLMKIIEDAEIAAKDFEMSEQKAQATYAQFVQDSTAAIQADRDAIAKKQGQVASAEAEKSETEEAQLANGEELSKLSDLLKAHHLDCDYLLKYFDVRQKARQEEMDAITDAKAILSGSDFGK